jgi:hypothetical protein
VLLWHVMISIVSFFITIFSSFVSIICMSYHFLLMSLPVSIFCSLVNSPSFLIKVHLSGIREVSVSLNSARVSDCPCLPLPPSYLHECLVSLLKEPHERLSLVLSHPFLNDSAPERRLIPKTAKNEGKLALY